MRVGVFLAGVLAALKARCVEIEATIVVLLIVWRVGAPIMRLYGKSRLIDDLLSRSELIHAPIRLRGEECGEKERALH